jgi:myo-inositol-1(or 4)-monophosphatase
MALVDQRRFDAVPTLRQTWEWAIAPDALLHREAGGISTDRNGNRLRCNNARPAVDGLLGGTPGVHQRLFDALEPPARPAPSG